MMSGFFRQGRYDRGEEHRQQWFDEVDEVESALRTARPSGDILELACGTGLWTQHLVSFATHLTGIDASYEVIKLNQERVNSASIEYIIADIFDWTPSQNMILCSLDFGFLIYQQQSLSLFWQMVKKSLKPNGRVFFVDSLLNQKFYSTKSSIVTSPRLC